MSKHRRYEGWIDGKMARPFKAPEWWSYERVAIAMAGRAMADGELDCFADACVEVIDRLGKTRAFEIKVTTKPVAS